LTGYVVSFNRRHKRHGQLFQNRFKSIVCQEDVYPKQLIRPSSRNISNRSDRSLDEDRRSGRFLLTGSANLMALPTVADSLAGRIETLSLLPLSQSEIESRSTNWIDSAFAGRILKVEQPALGSDLIERVLRGGYPEAISRASARRRVTWARQYIDAMIW
jgi:predicted AAA+ superfamily ATPase